METLQKNVESLCLLLGNLEKLGNTNNEEHA